MSSATFHTITYDGKRVVMLDQTLLPHEEVYRVYTSPQAVAHAIRHMVIRGAPAIGIAAAYGIALGAMQAAVSATSDNSGDFEDFVEDTCEIMAGTRPTAVNLFWAIRRMRSRLATSAGLPTVERAKALDEEARRIHVEDAELCERIGAFGAGLLPPGAAVLTHCNTGALATGGIGTALGVIRTAYRQGNAVRVYADETRPYLQGARLTVWELQKDRMDVTLIVDGAAASLLKSHKIDAVIVGTDRVARNGDVANKVGTLGLAVLANEFRVPFYVAAPSTTIDLDTMTGADIVIEERSPHEVTHLGGTAIAPDDTVAFNPAFDVTPARYITGIITEHGVATAPYDASLPNMIGPLGHKRGS